MTLGTCLHYKHQTVQARLYRIFTIKEDIRDIEQIRDLSLLLVLVELLPGKVGSLLSLNSLRVDLQVAHKTVALWMDVLEKFYYHFRIYPFHFKSIKSLRKEPKMYLCTFCMMLLDTRQNRVSINFCIPLCLCVSV
ncbi:MAG: DUF4143 domain-containing protein [Candidatus Anammoxibacter sp.]